MHMVGWRGWVVGLIGTLAASASLAGCDRQPAPGQSQSANDAVAGSGGELMSVTAAQQGPGLHLAYRHAIELDVAGSVLAAHFASARNKCVSNAAIHCVLLHAEIGQPRRVYGSESMQIADLRIRLPHDQVPGFAGALTSPLPGEAAGLVGVTRQSTTADDLGQPVADAAQRVAQLGEYLASLKVLGARFTISVADQVKIAEETARTQTQMEEAQTRQQELALRVDTEELDIGFTERRAASPTIDPVTHVLEGAQDSLRRNAAEALAFGIAAVPWIPVALTGLVVLWLARLLLLGRRPRV